MAVIIGADEGSSKDLAFFDTDVAPFRKHHERNILDQLSIDKIIDQRGSTIAKDQSVGQRTPHTFSKDRGAFHPSELPIYHRQPFKQTPLAALKGDAPFAKGQHSRRQWAALRDNPLEGQAASFAEVFEARKTRAPQQQLFTAETPFRDFLREQSAGLSFQKQAALIADYPFLSLDSFKFHDPYDKLVDLHGWQKDARTLPYEAPPMHAGYSKYLNVVKGASCDFKAQGKCLREQMTIRFSRLYDVALRFGPFACNSAIPDESLSQVIYQRAGNEQPERRRELIPVRYFNLLVPR